MWFLLIIHFLIGGSNIKNYHSLSNSVFIFRLSKIWRHYSEDITGRRRDEDIAVSSFSLYYTWLNDLRLYNCMILAIIIIMMISIYSGIVVIWDHWILTSASRRLDKKGDFAVPKWLVNQSYLSVPFTTKNTICKMSVEWLLFNF